MEPVRTKEEVASLYRRHVDMVYQLCLVLMKNVPDAEDAVQDAFVRYLERAPENLEHPSAWLMRVLVNGCKSRLRLAWRRVGPLPEMLPTPGPEERQELEELERSLAESRRHINSYAYGDDAYAEAYGGGSYRSDPRSEYARDLEEIQQRSYERQKAIEAGLGIGQPDPEEQLRKQRADSIAKAKKEERERNRPLLVLKSRETNADKFNTVGSSADNVDAPLIRAMIDKTTKAHEGTRLRFKLLDDVTIHEVRLPKGTYLYGTVTGFGQQRVRAAITSILVGGKFLKVNLSVFDNDGMEGFYVPESAFRDFMKEAGASTVQQNISFESESGYGSGISGEAIALQALQNMYNSATSAVSANIRKNKAKIKYNTIVYLINSDEAY